MSKFLPGKSGNPRGKPPMKPEIKEAMYANGEKAVQRMTELLEDDTAWGKEGWIDAKTQVKLAETAMQRAYGSPRPDESGDQPIVTVRGILREIYDEHRDELAEFINAEAMGADAKVINQPDEEEGEEDAAA